MSSVTYPFLGVVFLVAVPETVATPPEGAAGARDTALSRRKTSRSDSYD